MNIIGIDEIPEGQRFVALSDDGSKAGMFIKLRTECGRYIEAATGGPCDESFLQDIGYIFWLPLPYHYELWFEREKS